MTPSYFSIVETIVKNKKLTLSYQSSFFFCMTILTLQKKLLSVKEIYLALLCSFGYFGMTEVKNLHLISSKNSQSFFIEKDINKNTLDLHTRADRISDDQ